MWYLLVFCSAIIFYYFARRNPTKRLPADSTTPPMVTPAVVQASRDPLGDSSPVEPILPVESAEGPATQPTTPLPVEPAEGPATQSETPLSAEPAEDPMEQSETPLPEESAEGPAAPPRPPGSIASVTSGRLLKYAGALNHVETPIRHEAEPIPEALDRHDKMHPRIVKNVEEGVYA